MDRAGVRSVFALSSDDDNDSNCLAVVDSLSHAPEPVDVAAGDDDASCVIVEADDDCIDITDDVIARMSPSVSEFIALEASMDVPDVDSDDDGFGSNPPLPDGVPAGRTPPTRGWHVARRQSWRYFAPEPAIDISIRCFQCNQVGHRRFDCMSEPVHPPCFVCGSLEHREGVGCASAVNAASFCWICSNHHHDHRRCVRPHLKSSSASSRRLHCYVCGGIGHSNCGTAAIVAQLQPSCSNCSAAIHHSSECPQPRIEHFIRPADLAGRSPGRARCYVCGSSDHKVSECLRRKRRQSDGDLEAFPSAKRHGGKFTRRSSTIGKYRPEASVAKAPLKLEKLPKKSTIKSKKRKAEATNGKKEKKSSKIVKRRAKIVVKKRKHTGASSSH